MPIQLRKPIRRWLLAWTAAAIVIPAVLLAAAPPASADVVTRAGTDVYGALDYQVSISDDTPAVGDTLTFAYTVTNNGTAGGIGYQSITISGDPVFGSYLVSPVCTPGTGVVISSPCSIDPNTPDTFRKEFIFSPILQPGQTVTFTISFQVAAAAAGQTFTLSLANIAGAAPIVFTVSQPNADLAVSLAASSAALSSSVTYTVTVTNAGPGALTSATIVTQLPSQTTQVSGMSSGCSSDPVLKQVSCSVGALANGASTNRSFTATLGLLSVGTVTATAQRTASTPTDPNSANDTGSAACTALTQLVIVC